MSLQLDITVEDARWQQLDIADLTMTAAQAALLGAGLYPSVTEISVLACDDIKIALLNAEFREKLTATNVLSWPETDLAASVDGQTPHLPEPDPDGVFSLGDIAIAYDTCQREAFEAKIPMADHVTHLIVHGVLHLLGYDHVRDGDAVLMETLEIKILSTLGISDPYRVD